MVYSKALLVAAVLACSALYAQARCPNLCSGHGECGANDRCTCFSTRIGSSQTAGWTGPDCSQRVCPSDVAWGGVDESGNHPVLQCSGRGTCDSRTGACVCDPGYEGIACQRTSCPASCSGHGICVSQERFVELADAELEYNGWDADKHFGCLCDPGFRGPDCSLHECLSGTDSMLGQGSVNGRECSGRGLCDYATGTCQCFSGFYGEQCHQQTALV